MSKQLHVAEEASTRHLVTRVASEEAVAELDAVDVIWRHVHPQVAAVPEVLEAIGNYIGAAAHWTLPSVCQSPAVSNGPGMVRLLARIAASEPSDLDPLVKHKAFSDALEAAVERGNFPAMQWLTEEYLPSGLVRQALAKAASRGQLRMLQWMHENHRDRLAWGHIELRDAVASRHLETAKWLLTHASSGSQSKLQDHIINAVVQNLSLDTLHWSIQQINAPQALVDSALSNFAEREAELGRLESLKTIRSQAREFPAATCLCKAMKAGHFDVVKWLYSPEVVASASALRLHESMQVAAARKRWDMVKWSLMTFTLSGGLENRCFSRLVSKAAGQGNLDMSKYLYELWPEPRSTGGTYRAACAGHFELVRWLNKRVIRGGSGIDGAARHGHLDIIQWLHRKRPKGACSVKAMNWAAAGNHLAVVVWLSANRMEGCTTDAMDGAAANGHLAVLKWLHSNRREGCTTDAMDDAATNGKMDVVLWLHSHRREGCTVRAMDGAAANGHLGIIEWLHRRRREGCSTAAIDEAVSGGHLDVAKWLLAHRDEGCSSQALAHAVRGGYIDMLEWLLILNPTVSIDRAVECAVAYGRFDALLVLHRTGRVELPLTRGLAAAVHGGHCELVQFLVREYGALQPGLAVFLRNAAAARWIIDWKGTYVLDCLRD